MQNARHAVTVAQKGQGWTWELIDADGVTTAAGVAAHQEGAMELAWRAARSFPQTAPDGFPDIVLSYPDSDLGRSRSSTQRRRRS
jgi:hypothetical protein